ncbi:hypothetical protein MYRA21_3339 [Myroides sp. A21]|uniref:hypothetical protein n=1 Tax=Myroides sp. A21 TaxID=1583100 RepID=UPI00057ED13C|nr:hypothetical protein [Myroides sp. A21]AJA70432.1 hypothetical protein MYRA21_3339 [Myroides sp. A21]
MKQKILIIACLCIGSFTYAQSGKSFSIGVSAPDPSALLHIESDQHGVLIPNVQINNITDKAPIKTNIKESLLVFNKGTKTVEKGYYYWTINQETSSGKWVRVLTSDDHQTILDGQIQESFIEEIKDGKGTGVFIYTPDKNQANDTNAPGRLVLDIPHLVQQNQTLTSFGLEQFELYHYSDKQAYRKKLTLEEELEKGVRYERTTKELELAYTDENKDTIRYAIKDLLGADNDSVPAITGLKIDGSGTGLIYTNDKGISNTLSLIDAVKRSETVTSLNIDQNDNLVFINERGNVQQVSMRGVVREPWHKPEDNTEAQSIKDNIFTSGWVGIGLSPEEAKSAIAKPKQDEKLRINGSIYARNSYYADYVFENYYTNEASDLNLEYSFKDLSTVESYIKNHYHLPGITPIKELDKSLEQGYLINVSELSVQLLEKVEELYLHTIEQQKVIDLQKSEINELKDQFKELLEYVKQNK